MRLEAWTPALGQQEILDKCIGLLHRNATDPETALYVIDNGSKNALDSAHAFVIRNEENRGMVGSLNQAVEHSTADVIVYLHSDMYLYEEGWDRKIIHAFKSDPKLAALGVVGAEVAEADGGRSRVWCSFRDWPIHGSHPRKEITPVALLDGCLMAFRRSVLQETNLDALEENGYLFSYDKDLTLTLTMDSHRVAVIDLDCQHIGGQTSCREEFNDTLKSQGLNLDDMYKESERRYIEKWKPCFPVAVMQDWTVHVGRRS